MAKYTTWFLLSLVVIISGCATSTSTSNSSANSKPYYDVLSPIYAPWGVDQITLMKTAQQRGLNYQYARNTDENVLKLHYFDAYHWTIVFTIANKIYNSLTVIPWDSDWVHKQFDLYIPNASDVDRDGRLYVKSTAGMVVIEKGYSPEYGGHYLSFTHRLSTK